MASTADVFSKIFGSDRNNDRRIASPGNQHIVQLLKGGYLGADMRDGDGRAALDIGCGNGFNLVSLAQMGWQAFGCDISSDILQSTKSRLQTWQVEADLRVGLNGALPYDDACFELALSINAIHYASSEAEVRRGVADCARVLRPGGWLLMETHHPSNWLLKGATPVDDHVVRVTRTDDPRTGQTMFVFADASEIEGMLSDYFSEINIGRQSTFLISKTLDRWFIAARRA